MSDLRLIMLIFSGKQKCVILHYYKIGKIMVTTLKKGSSRSRISKLLEKIKQTKPLRGIDAYKYCGLIKLEEDPKIIQRKMRDEWD